jgi:hypothetical protein
MTIYMNILDSLRQAANEGWKLKELDDVLDDDIDCFDCCPECSMKHFPHSRIPEILIDLGISSGAINEQYPITLGFSVSWEDLPFDSEGHPLTFENKTFKKAVRDILDSRRAKRFAE